MLKNRSNWCLKIYRRKFPPSLIRLSETLVKYLLFSNFNNYCTWSQFSNTTRQLFVKLKCRNNLSDLWPIAVIGLRIWLLTNFHYYLFISPQNPCKMCSFHISWLENLWVKWHFVYFSIYVWRLWFDTLYNL